MTNRPWNTGELKVLRVFGSLGAIQLAELLERSASSVQAKARELHVSLEVTGEDIELSWSSAQLLERVRRTPGLSICPLCGLRLAIMRNTGMCRVCHLDQLIHLREVQLAELARERKLTKLRQDKRRLRICTVCGDAYYPRMAAKQQVCARCEDLV